MNNVTTARTYPVTSHACKVLSVTRISPHTYQVELQSTSGAALRYQAGQYLELALDLNGGNQQQSLFYSIANGLNPEQPHRLQLFIQNSSKLTDKTIKHLTKKSNHKANIKVTLAMGQAFLQTDLNAPHVLIAAGSGISQIKCLTEEIIRQKTDAAVNIYWSNKNIDDFYLIDQFQDWESQHKNLNFTPILESNNTRWLGRSGYIFEVIEDDFKDLFDANVYLCGSPQMVYGTIDKLKATGLKEENCYSDIYEYAPRDQKIAI